MDNTGRRSVVSALVGLCIATILAACGGGDSLAQLRSETARYSKTETAQAAGWDLDEGLDHCFDNPGVGAMGFHYIDADRLDTELDWLKPEALVYQPAPNGDMHLGAVEYIVPAEPWDAANDGVPTLNGHSLHLNEALGVYVLHVWHFSENPAGTYEDWNPEVSCPAA